MSCLRLWRCVVESSRSSGIRTRIWRVMAKPPPPLPGFQPRQQGSEAHASAKTRGVVTGLDASLFRSLRKLCERFISLFSIMHSFLYFVVEFLHFVGQLTSCLQNLWVNFWFIDNLDSKVDIIITGRSVFLCNCFFGKVFYEKFRLIKIVLLCMIFVRLFLSFTLNYFHFKLVFFFSFLLFRSHWCSLV